MKTLDGSLSTAGSGLSIIRAAVLDGSGSGPSSGSGFGSGSIMLI
uniref:Uncharacterized protein n=1 Tax=Anguilla anguilla TaxID=7936 RepID=A0A0E9TFD6_ANGAN